MENIDLGGDAAGAGDPSADGAWPQLESFLDEAATQAAAGAPATITIRELLAHIEAERRGTRVVEEIQHALERYHLVTESPFTSGWIDNVVELRTIPLTPESLSEQSPPSLPGTDASSSPDISLTVSSLRSAGAGAISIERNDSLERARALMSDMTTLNSPSPLGLGGLSVPSAGNRWHELPSVIPTSH